MPGPSGKLGSVHASKAKTRIKKQGKLRASGSKGRSLSGRTVPHRRQTLPEVSTFDVQPVIELKFRRTGYKCVTMGSRSLPGVHPTLETFTGFSYDRAKEQGKLTDEELPPASYTEDVPQLIAQEQSHRAYSRKEGENMDRQVGQMVAWHRKRGVKAPLRIFYDPAARQRFLRTGRLEASMEPYMPVPSADAKSIEKLCDSLSPEACHLAHYCHTRKLDMVATQICVAQGNLGTRVDLLLKTTAGTYIVVELKRGCAKDWTEGKPMPFPFRSMDASSHGIYMLQALLNRRMFQNTYPTAKLCAQKPCMLLRLDHVGLHEYYPTQDMLRNEGKLAAVLRCV